MGLGLGLALLWTKLMDRTVPDVRSRLRWKVLAGAAAVGLIVAAVFFSGLFTNWRGPIDAVRTYSTYLGRGTGAGDHDKPFGYYLRLLLHYRYGRGPIHTEVFIIALAVVGVVRALWPAAKEQLARAVFLRFIAFYTVGLLLIYSAIPYKTPWCLLGFLHGLILLAGVGAVAIVRVMPHISLRYVAAALLMVPAGHLAYQAWRINFKDFHDPRRNPYLYSTPTRNFLELVQRLEDLTKVAPDGRHMYIRVVTSDCWPLPWYLRSFARVEYWNTPSERDPYAAVVIGSRLMEPDLDARLGDAYMQEHYGLRPQVILSVYIDKQLWESFIKSRSK
jgi:predicted membrane-bound mannosyltransferase